MNRDDEGRPYKANDGDSGESLVETSGQENLEDWINETSKVFGNIELVTLPEPLVKLSKVIHKRFDQPFPEWLNENVEKYGRALLTSPDTLIPQEIKEEPKEGKPVVQEKPSWESLQDKFRAIENEYFDCVNHWRDGERCKRAEKLYFGALEKLEILKGLYGLEVLHANDHEQQPEQHGWTDLYYPISNFKMHKKYRVIQSIRNLSEKKVYVENGKDKRVRAFEPKVKISLKDKRLWLYERGIISEEDIYAWFYDLVWRQNNEAIVIVTKEGERKAIDNLSGRWNKKRPFGYQVRKRLRGILHEIENPLLLTLTISDKLIIPLMPYNTNLDPVSFSITKIGEWIREFGKKLFMYQQRRGIDWQFKAWTIEFQEKNNCGFPHIHMIFAGNWIGRINEIKTLWPHGIAELTTKKDIEKRYPGRKINSLRLANYLTKYVSKSGSAITEEGIHKGYAWLAFSGGRIFSVKHEKKENEEEL